MSTENVTGRVAVVTGGASGMGLAICHHLARKGHRVAVLDLDGDVAERVSAELRDAGANSVSARVDVADRSSVDAAFSSVRDALGPTEILVTSAAIAAFVPFHEITDEQWARMIAVNLDGTFYCLQAALRDMIAANYGRIVTISSTAGQNGSRRQGHYAASKGGVIGMTKAVALEYASMGITANTIPPFSVDTPMLRAALAGNNLPSVEVLAQRVPAGRLGTPDDIAATCAFLCSEEAGYITGQVISPNGGAVT
jgi:NAD(P)-dependent dehydrogenase (short-subunit alcohol dehydrogenase family)